MQFVYVQKTVLINFCPSLLAHSHLPADMLLLFQAVLFELLINYEKKLSSELLLRYACITEHPKQQQSYTEILVILCP